jgi:hypothetical protein
MHVILAPHRIFGADFDLCELLACFLEFEAEMLRQPFNVALGELDQWLGAAIAGAFCAVIHDATPED